jgi:ribose transport system substrate-binding protein
MDKLTARVIVLVLFLLSFLTIVLLSTYNVGLENNANKAPLFTPEDSPLVVTKLPTQKRLAYIVSDTRIPFWSIMERGVQKSADELGYKLDIYSAENSPMRELEFVAKAIRDNVSGIIVSPTTSSACTTILKLASSSNIPVVISDIGTDGGDYLSYISSNNQEGAYQIGNILAKQMSQRNWDNGKVGIIAIPQKRLNGQARTTGFMQAMDKARIKSADIKQQSTFSYQETYDYTKELIENHPNLRAIWLQGSDRYQGALDAIEDGGKKGKILLLTFDAEPEFIDLISKGILVASAMQQPYLMGEKAVNTMDMHLKGQIVPKNQQLPVLAVSRENIQELQSVIQRNVLGIESKNK